MQMLPDESLGEKLEDTPQWQDRLNSPSLGTCDDSPHQNLIFIENFIR